MSSNIPVIRSSMPAFDEYTREISSLWKSRWLTNTGEKHRVLQEKLIDYLQVDNVELTVNGHTALELTLQAMHMEGQVITTPFTFASTTHAIVRSGLEPVFCDINCEDYTMDVSKIEELITEKTCAILPVHVYGNICDIEKIQDIADRYKLKVIYDASHTFGMKRYGEGIGNCGDASCFSFHATKVFHTIEGGAVCFRDSRLGDEIRRLRNFGIEDQETVLSIGTNGKMNEFCAAMGICNLRCIDQEISRRREIMGWYCEGLADVKGILLNKTQNNVDINGAYFPVIVDEAEFGIDRDELSAKLLEHGITVRKYFYPLTNTFQCYRDGFGRYNTPVAKSISERVLTLPMYSELTLSDVDCICSAIINCGV